MKAGKKKRIIIAVTGASGVIYGDRMLRYLSGRRGIETHLIISNAAGILIREELGKSPDRMKKSAFRSYGPDELDAPLASGSFHTDCMAVIPCSMKTLSAVANSYADSLLTRAADVTLKERRPLVLVVRETPLHAGHLELMLRATRMGAVILPASPAFYGSPKTIEDLADQVVGRTLDALGIDNDVYTRWKGP
jgi:4-hydroxy-3-polyprenylbenzoate decarboxylase